MEKPIFKDELRCSPQCPFLSPDWTRGYCGQYKKHSHREVLFEGLENGKPIKRMGHILRLKECRK